MTGITLEAAAVIVDATIEAGRTANARPLTVAVLDPGGHLTAFKREDGSGILRPDIAIGKAWGALGMGNPSGAMAARAKENPAFYAALAAMSGGRVVPVPGGVLISDESGEIVGAVGVSGDTSQLDEECAVQGVRAAHLEPLTEPDL
jgi:uncharacterized protein GlcG (DUF336 family)